MAPFVSKAGAAQSGTGDSLAVRPAAGPLRLEYSPPGDEQISQLALCLGALCAEPLQIQGLATGQRIEELQRLLGQLGAEVGSPHADLLEISSPGGRLHSPDLALDCGDSMSNFLLLCGLVAGRKLSAELSCRHLQAQGQLGDLLASLTELGAEIVWLRREGYSPLRIRGCPLRPQQVKVRPEYNAHKSMLLLAGLGVVGELQLSESLPIPDHCERLLRYLSVEVARNGNLISMAGEQPLKPARLRIPADFTPAAALLSAAMLLPGSEVHIPMVGANPLRFGLPRKLARLGARLERHRDWQFGSEPVSSITLRSPRRIPAFNVPPTLAQTMLDEFSLLALIATQAHGASHLRGAETLARRSPNQLLLTTQILREMGADVELETGGLSVSGLRRLSGGQLFCAGERSMALLACSAALAAEGQSELLAPGDLAAVYPDFTDAVAAAGA